MKCKMNTQPTEPDSQLQLEPTANSDIEVIVESQPVKGKRVNLNKHY